ncbi:MAG: hypothetical protein IAG13_00145 [Deltaproteobacteria bacterium]|nr:hypothetical protein [Nannocystaceae bacterium]
MTSTTLAAPPLASPTATRVFVVLVVWFSVLLGLGVAGMIDDLPPIAVPIGLIGSTAALVLAHLGSATLRAWVRALDVRVLVGYHVLRAPIGLWFLMAYRRGELPGELALRAGWGDILCGLLALVVLPLGLTRARDRKLLWAWNLLGTLDILMVVLTAQKMILFDDPAGMRAAIAYPFVLLPWFVVPLVLVTHALVFARLRAASR